MFDQLHKAASAQQSAAAMQELERSLPLRQIKKNASEFEQSRQASKTWPMGQD